ncbi:hypothetical protein ANI_1_2086014 [Paecilomyces variotii No. 5]|uniref:Uncharacterized protein n=1 Tax=Byssochlamys spectabilis (strain No. 5 / NBRC 109023) TaxID=1356009 RepID=V5G965_BYSSN|nr:hypothetical protein ANI_1_2086014 [Paecilomyces variotii No. 5]
MAGLIKLAVQGVAGGIGLASESTTAYKNKKKAQKEAQKDDRNDPTQAPTIDEGSEDDEEQWELDEAQDELVGGSNPQRSQGQSVDELLSEFLHRNPPESDIELSERPRIPCPVILPQRRPKDRSRGFIRAYAPVLADCGIDQTMFLDFLESFNASSQASPWLNTINLASIGTMFLPHGISVAVSVAIQVTTNLAIEMQARTRTNTFLDKVNEEFFQPRGVYCLIMTWDPESNELCESVNIDTAVRNAVDPGQGIGSKIRRKLRSSNGTTYANFEFPETAPLVYPGLDYLAMQRDGPAAEEKNRLKSGKAFVEDYLDRRAQAKFASANPENMLSQGPKPQFTSRYADPSHPASSGSLVSLLTGGYVNPPPLAERRKSRGRFRDGRDGFGVHGNLGRFGDGGRRRRLGDFRDRRDLRRFGGSGRSGRTSWGQSPEGDGEEIPQGNGFGGRGNTLSTRLGSHESGNPRSGLGRGLGGDVLYLMIVNMPSDEDMAEAQRTADQLLQDQE